MPARILIADDETTFLDSTADLLRRDGHQVHCAADAPSAAALLRRTSFDLLIADINMPGNPDLELIDEVRRHSAGLPVIIVTGYPSTKTAIQAVRLAVVSYLVKPFEFSDLQALIQSSLERSAIYKSVSGAQDRLRRWLEELQATKEALTAHERVPAAVLSENYLAVTLHNMMESLQELKGLFDRLGQTTDRTAPSAEAHLRVNVLVHAVRDSIAVLERTKGSFKSRELKVLRERLEQVVRADVSPRP